MSKMHNLTPLSESLREKIVVLKEKNISYSGFKKCLDLLYKQPTHTQPVELKPAELLVPISVFDNEKLSALESIVKFLHENKDLRFSEIGRLISRDQRAVGVTYRFARKKMASSLKPVQSKYSLPLAVIAERKLSVLESIVYHLKKTYSLSYHEIALLIRRDDRTVWTVYNRALDKLNALKGKNKRKL